MQAEHIFRTTRHCGDRINVLIRGIGCENGSRLAHGIQLHKDFLFQFGIFKYRLDNHVGIGQCRIIRRARNQGAAARRFFFTELAAFDATRIVAVDNREASLQGLVADLDHGDRDPGIRETHRDSAAHRTATDNANTIDRPHRCVFRQAINLCGLTLCEKHVPHTGGLRAAHALHEQFPLFCEAFLKGHCRGRFDCRDNISRRDLPAGTFLEHGPIFIEDCRIEFRYRLFTALADRHAAVDKFPGPGHGGIQQVFVYDLIDDTDRCRFSSRYWCTAGHEIQRRFDARKPWQTLCSTGARQQAEFNFRQPNLRGCHCTAIVRGQCCFQATTQRCAVYSSDNWLG